MARNAVWDGYIFDLDGTLTPAGADADSDVLEALHRLHSSGASIIIATGRTLNAGVAVLDGAGVPGFVIASNGGIITREPGGEILRRSVMPDKMIAELVQIGRRPGIEIALFRTHDLVMERPGRAADHTRNGNSQVPISFEPIDEADWSDVLKVMYWAEPDTMAEHLPHMTALQPGIVQSMETVAEMSTPGAAKEDALEWLAGSLRFNLRRCLGIGDSGNDLAWLPLVGHSVAPDNATSEIKAAVDEVIGSQESGAVVRYIDELARERNRAAS
ncbi:HAD-IIB family hydrolase [Flaviflexus huanghaiensis]|uniref:HAD-IIB family hydrolase n=1 Tax=Flaviflexus huanghaiensis TaxID=1111473 RepID=UPI0015F9BF8B